MSTKIKLPYFSQVDEIHVKVDVSLIEQAIVLRLYNKYTKRHKVLHRSLSHEIGNTSDQTISNALALAAPYIRDLKSEVSLVGDEAEQEKPIWI